MPFNIELKAKIDDCSELEKVVAELSDVPVEVLDQEDTFFNLGTGRLKLRVFTPDYGELIYYERNNTKAPKPSSYVIFNTTQPVALKLVLTSALGIKELYENGGYYT